MADQTAVGSQKPLAAPYTAYQSVKTVIGTHKEHGVPSCIDRTMLKNFSGAVASQVLTALRFLRLIDDDGHPLSAYKGLADLYGTDQWKAEIGKVLSLAYAALFEHDLTATSPGQFNEYFRLAYPSEGETLRKGITFFLNAARDADIPMSPYITSAMKQRSAGATGRRRSVRYSSAKAAATQRHTTGNGTEEPRNPTVLPAPTDLKTQLVAKFPAFDPSWDDAIKQKWFEGFRQLVDVADKPRRREQKSGKAD